MPKKTVKVLDFLDFGIFPPIALFSCGFSYDEITSLLKKKKAKDWLLGISDDKGLIDKANYIACRRDIINQKTGEQKWLFYIILKGQFTYTDYEYCKLAHEILHICQFALPDILTRDTEIEAEAYLHTHLMKQCLKTLRGN